MTRICILSSVHIALDNRVFYREARSLRRAGYDLTLIAIHDRDEVKDGIQIIALPRVPRWQRPRLWLILLRRALASRADLFHFHDPELLLVTPWLRLLTGKPTVYDVHEVYADFIEVKEYLPGWLRSPIAQVFRKLEPLLARLQSGLVFADEQIAATFRKLSRPKATLFNFPEHAFVAQAVEATEAGELRAPVVLHLGGHKRSRGTDLMLEAFHIVLREYPEARLRLVGPFSPPQLEQEMRNVVSQHQMGHTIQIVGRVPFEQIGQYLKQAAVGWVAWQATAKNEKNIPTKLFEYMAYAVPIVTSDLASIRPFVQDGDNGYLASAGDPMAHAQAILRLLRNPDQAREMGRRGQALVLKDYGWDEMEKRLLAFYSELLGSKHERDQVLSGTR